MSDLSLTGSSVLMGLIILLVLVVGFILIYKAKLRSAAGSNLKEKYADKTWKSPLESRSKYPDVNVFTLARPVWLFGLVAALLTTLFAFSWTSYDEEVYIPDDALLLDEEIEIEPPRTKEPPPPPPPPPPPIIEEVPEEEIEEEDEPVFESMDVEEETVIEEPEPVVEEAPPPPPPPPPPPETDEIFKVVEQMPRFPGCEGSGSKEEIEKCAEQKMLQFIYKNLKYPAIARENGVEGMCVLQFVVDKAGNVTDAKIVRNIGAGCGESAMKVVNTMPQWIPGKQRGRAVKVLYTLPVRFKLEG